MRFFFLFLWAGMLASPAELLEDRTLPGGVEVRLIAPINLMPSGGFFPLRVELVNPSSQGLSWSLESEATLRMSRNIYYSFRSSSADEGSASSRFDLTCPAGENRQLDLLVPVPQAGENDERNLSLRVTNGKGRALLSSYLSSDPVALRFGLSGTIYGKWGGAIRSAWMPRVAKRSSYSGSAASFLDAAGVFNPGELPADWRAFAGYDALVFNQADLDATSAGVRVALDQWVRSGGHLILLSDKPESGVETGEDGFGRRSELKCGEFYNDFNPLDLINRLYGGTEALTTVHFSEYRGPDWQLGSALGSRSLQTGLLLFALIVFAIVVGPVNLFVWANKNRRHRLFITTPLISLVGSLIMVAFIIFRDGFGGEGARAIAIEVGGPDNKTAAIVQEQFSRSGILFSADLPLDDETVLIPLRPPTTDLNREDSPSDKGTFQLRWESTKEGWDLSGDLFESRSEQAQLLRAVVPSREGLTLVSQAGETPRLASSFAYALGPVFYTDREGEVWKAEAMGPGEAVSLKKSDLLDQKLALTQAIDRFGESNRKTLRNMVLRRNSFAALAEEAPGVETHSSIDWQTSPVVVTGLTGR